MDEPLQHLEHGPVMVCSHEDPGLTVTYFMARSSLAPYAFVWEKMKKWIFRIYHKLCYETCISGPQGQTVSIGIKILPPGLIFPSSILQHLQTSSLKPLGRLKPNCIWSLHGSGEQSLFAGSWSLDQDGHQAHIW